MFPIFRDAERVIADPVVRNRGTLGGSLCQADPSEDLTAVCTALDASLRDPRTVGRAGGRRWTTSTAGPYETSLAHNEMLIEIRIPVRPNGSSAYAKVERRAGDWAVTAAGAAVWLDGDIIAAARVGLAAVNADTAGSRESPRRCAASRRPRSSSRRPAAMPRQACAPVTDMRGSAEYKRHLADELTGRTLRTAVERVRNAPAPEGN